MIVLGFYKYTKLDEPAEVAASLREFCSSELYKGTILVSREGLNGSVSANRSDTDALRSFLLNIRGCSNIFFKEEDTYNDHPFKKMKVKVKNEIVRFDYEVDLKNRGDHISPDEFLDLYNDDGSLREGVVLLDTRNDYEYEIGHFKGATHLDLKTFRKFTKKSIWRN